MVLLLSIPGQVSIGSEHSESNNFA